ncbi:cell growth regulator with RING finger domain protein 1 isoform X2 [Microtus ochrogaster]|uniref:Cell growth regulator with RING finger domain protein 1 isoform X2 n=1 Tax=Microtus ochrogaster TaxID=79684 RepID=A0ABM1UAL5_MICOH|nr:cell growth regulator with RING finger domain protein 1 isoform X2 [Microtus ochrogaster]
MAAVFLVTLYEYSPLFYIAVVFTCFIVTTGLVLGWFGWDVPVILRNSEETQFSTRTFKKQMRQVKNPFGLEISNPSSASLAAGMTLTADCLENSRLTCFWGCSVQKLYEALQKHVYCFRISTPQALEEALYSDYLHREQYFIKKHSKEELYCQLPSDTEIDDFGPVPRSRYPLVALLTLADEEDREIYDIQLFMSANSSPSPSSRPSPADRSAEQSLLEKAGLAGSDVEPVEESSKDCVVCQNGGVNWVLLPCRHACLCDSCVCYFKQCPMCRQFVQESFALCSQKEPDKDVLEAS